MNVLIACEESQRVCTAFRNKNHNAYSCDLQKESGNHPEWHIQTNVLSLINGNCEFTTNDGLSHYLFGEWDLIIAHPPCTYLTNSCSKYYDVKSYGAKAIERNEHRKEAVKFFLDIANANCQKIAIENPVGYMNTHYRKPDCIYNPYDFIGETECKRTCLWLKNLSPLKGTREVPLPIKERTNNGFNGYFNGQFYSWNSSECSRLRSQTPWGVALAMSEQWG